MTQTGTGGALDAPIGIVGAGLGGLTVAALLQAAGIECRVYERAGRVERIGAGIHVAPNMVRILRQIGAADELVAGAAIPDRWISRDARSGELLLDFPLGSVAATSYGEPYLTLHRGDLHAALLGAVEPGTVRFDHRLRSLDEREHGVTLRFANGASETVGLVIGADGVRSQVREALLGPQPQRFAATSAYRISIPANALREPVEECVKWWGGDRMLMAYFITHAHDEVFVVTAQPDPEWPHDSLSVVAPVREVRDAFATFEPRVQRLLDAATSATKWAMFDFQPLALWSRDRVVMLGDACHPMLPYMGQGGAMAIEDAAVLARCLVQEPTEHERAFRLFELNRRDRAAAVQSRSRRNDWLRSDDDADWVFGFDAWTEPLRPLEHDRVRT